MPHPKLSLDIALTDSIRSFQPVSFLWMERKVTEWGCMQALIDFDGWRKWKDLAAREEANKKGESKADQKAALKAMFNQPPRTKKEKERDNVYVGGPVGGGGPAGVGGGGQASSVRTKSPTNVRKAIGKSNTMDTANANGIDGKSDSSTSGGTTIPEKR
jgi:hypothetical protein